MSTYLNIYLIERESKKKRELTSYSGSSPMMEIMTDVVSIPDYYKYDTSFSEEKEQQREVLYKELSRDDISEMLSDAQKRIKEYEGREERYKEERAEAKKALIEIYSKHDVFSVNDFLKDIEEANYYYVDEDQDTAYLAELRNTESALVFLEILLYEFSLFDDTFYSGIAVNES